MIARRPVELDPRRMRQPEAPEKKEREREGLSRAELGSALHMRNQKPADVATDMA